MIKLNGAARPRTDAGLAAAADIIGCEVEKMLAVIKVEAPRGPFDNQNRPNILFEPHVFYRNLSGTKRSAAVSQKLAARSWGAIPYGKYSAQYGKLLRAIKIDESAALKACSWGSPQILGENHAVVGYSSPQAMVRAFAESEDEQLQAMARFIVSKNLARHIISGKWASFAYGYNGSGYKKNRYDEKLADAYAELTQGRPVGLLASDDEPEIEGTNPDVHDDVAGGGDDEPLSTLPSLMTEAAQHRLRELGYATVGNPDGENGTLSVGGVAAFQKDRGIPVTGEFDKATFLELDKASFEGWSRPIGAGRALATAEQIKAKVPEAKAAWKAKVGAYVQAGVGGAGFVGTALLNYASDAWSATRQIRQFFSDVPPIVWFGLAAGVAIWMALHARNAQKASDDAYRTGARV